MFTIYLTFEWEIKKFTYAKMIPEELVNSVQLSE